MKKLCKIIWGHVKLLWNRNHPDWVKNRRDICNSCVHQKGIIRKRCGLCLCTTKVKTTFKEESCPLGFWREIDNT